MLLQNKNIVITGSNRGIGFAIAKKCLEEGANVFSCVRDIECEGIQNLKETAQKLGCKVFEVPLDLESAENTEKAATIILNHKLKIDAIVNNAGITGYNKLFSMTKIEEIKKVFEVNFFSPLLFTQKLLKNMIRNKKGSIINISSITQIDGKPDVLPYTASKMAINAATWRLSYELGRFGIRVNSIAPGVTNTDMAKEHMSEDIFNTAVSHTFLKRAAEPLDIASLACFLASDASSYITGQTIRIDGGAN